MSKVKVAAVQMRCAPTVEENLQHAEALVREAAANGAQIILLPELWERPYFCQQRRYDFYQYALPTEENPAVTMAGFTMGIMILNRMPGLEQPSSMAASSRSRGMPRIYWAMRKMKKP